jgi:regulatory protein
MRISIEVVSKPDQRDIRIIVVNGEPWKKIHVAIFGRLPSFSSTQTIEEWEAAFDQLEYKKAKNYVLRRLAAKSYHSHQLFKLLKERLVQSATSQRLIHECIEWGYLNDSAWLDSFIQSHLKRSSQRAISAKLYAKGIPIEEVQNKLLEYNNPDVEKEGIKKLLATRYRSKDLTNYRERQAVIAGLIRKGYSFERIQEVVSNL